MTPANDEVLRARSIVVMADDFRTEDLPDALASFSQKIVRATSTYDFERDTRIFPHIKTIVLPISSYEVGQFGIRAGWDGVIAVDDAHITYAPPGAEAPEEKAKVRAIDPLVATRVVESRFCGAGIGVLVLDVGLDENHPDIRDRRPKVSVRDFVTDPIPHDSGHGTRSVGLACGPRYPVSGARYGVAYCADLVVGRVLSSNTLTGIDDVDVFAGIDAAVAERIPIVNMSLGVGVSPTSSYGTAFEAVAHRALTAGVLLIAAAGNDDNVGLPGVKHPANCPSVLSVGALDGSLHSWSGSCVRVRCDAEVDIVAPGFDIRSSTIGGGYSVRSSTSAAAAIASGIAALWAEATGRRGCDLWNTIVDATIPVTGGRRPATGAGLVQAPVF